jgi:hypothetical protein
MARPSKEQTRLSLRIDPGAHARLKMLSKLDKVTFTEKVEEIINNEYRWKFGILERDFTYAGMDFEDLPLPLPGPTIIEQSQLIQREEERLQTEIKQLEEKIEKYMEKRERRVAQNPAAAIFPDGVEKDSQ